MSAKRSPKKQPVVEEHLQPRANPDLLGQAAAEQRLLQALRSGRFPHRRRKNTSRPGRL